MIDILQAVVLPSGLATLLFLAGLVSIAFPRSRRIGCLSLIASAAVMLSFANGLVATMLLSPLEYEFAALRDPRAHPEVRTIVILTAYAADDTRLPLSSQPNSSSAFRVLEAANLHALRPDCRVIISGSDPAARIMAKQLRVLGVPGDKITVDARSNNTAVSAQFVRQQVAATPVFLITSAGHMRRAAGVLRKQGVALVPAPTDYLLPRTVWTASWTTSAVHLQASDLAVHEYIGLAWYHLTGKL